MATLTANAFPRYAIVEGGYKLVLSHRDGVWRSQLYRSGHEGVDLAPAAPQLASRLRTRLDELRKRYHRGTPERRQELGPEEESQLRALGYVEEGT